MWGLAKPADPPGSCLLYSDCAFVAGSHASTLLGLPTARDAAWLPVPAQPLGEPWAGSFPPHLQSGIIVVPTAGRSAMEMESAGTGSLEEVMPDPIVSAILSWPDSEREGSRRVIW